MRLLSPFGLGAALVLFLAATGIVIATSGGDESKSDAGRTDQASPSQEPEPPSAPPDFGGT